MKNAINWFEIPVNEIDKAKKFYETILGTEVQLVEAMGMKSDFFPSEMETGGIGGWSFKSKDSLPCYNPQ